MSPTTTTWAVQRVLRDAETEEQERLRRYERAWRAYHGDFDKPLKVDSKPGQPAIDDNVLLPWVQEIVDDAAAFLFPEPPDIEVGESSDTTTPEEQWLSSVFAVNKWSSTLTKLARNGAVCGHVFLKIQPRDIASDPMAPIYQPPPADPDDTTPASNIAVGEALPRLIVLDPANVRPYWSGEDIEDVWQYEVSWIEVDRNNRPRLRRQRITRAEDKRTWTITDQTGDVNSGVYIDDRSEEWPYPFAPILDAQNLPCPNEFFGMSDVEAVALDLNRAANARASDLARTHRLLGHPKAWAKGMTKEQAALVDWSIDSIAVMPNPDASLELLAVDGQAMSTALEFLRWLSDEFRKATRSPEVTPEKLKTLGDLSGVALKIIFRAGIAKTVEKHGTYGDLLADLVRRLLTIAGFTSGYHDAAVEIRWGEVVPTDPKAEAETAQAKQAVGVSKDTTLRELGYDPEDEAEKRDIENEQALATAQRAFDAGQQLTGDPTASNAPPAGGG